ncbi:hypothetical protein [Streptomyces sp. DSM 40484]|uniref:hypothetical protein n=1 Tax=Streptomyces kroppenstedtii TaxID=3051181 RepID=UPI0028D4D8E6|nr:hypothetical protein [Streptomyces sp. DSM 40484]
MTTHLRYALSATAGAIALAALATACVAQRLHLVAAFMVLGAAVLAEAAVREYRRHRRVVAEAQWVRRACTPYCPHPGPLDPCCLLAKASRGKAHRYCTRPSTEES